MLTLVSGSQPTMQAEPALGIVTVLNPVNVYLRIFDGLYFKSLTYNDSMFVGRNVPNVHQLKQTPDLREMYVFVTKSVVTIRKNDTKVLYLFIEVAQLQTMKLGFSLHYYFPINLSALMMTFYI